MSNKYDISLIRKYLKGELDASAMYKLERQAQEDPLLMDLIMGVESGDENEHELALFEIDDLITKRTAPQKRKVIPLFRWSIAASVILISGIAFVLLLKEKTPTKTALRTAKSSSAVAKNVIKDNSDTSKKITAPLIIANTERKPVSKRKLGAEHLLKLIEDSRIAMLPDGEKTDSVMLNDVVVVGYGSQKKESLVGSVATVHLKELTPQSALQGRVPGVSVTGYEGKSLTVTGIVRDKENKFALPGVSVRVKGSNTGTVTDINGRFTLTLPESGETLELSYIGFEPKSVKVKNSDSLIIAMSPSNASLSEVVVVGYGRRKSEGAEQAEERRQAQPVNGWKEYNKYLKDQATADNTSKGVVVLTFNVHPDGFLDDFKIIKSSNPQLNEKAIELVKDGPKWLGLKEYPQKVRLRIRFREKEN